MDNRWARLIIFLFWDPHLLECRQWSKDGSSDPYGVFPLWWSNDFDFHCGWGKGSNFLLHTVSNTWIHGGTSRQYSVGIQVLTNVDITLHDRIVCSFMNTTGFHTQEGWLEEGFWATESFISNSDYLSVREFIWFFFFSNEEEDAAVAISCSKSKAT